MGRNTRANAASIDVNTWPTVMISDMTTELPHWRIRGIVLSASEKLIHLNPLFGHSEAG